MKKEIAEKWIEALRSGEYEQGTGVLKTRANEFCCLGVLCDIVKDEHGLEWKLLDEDDYFYHIISPDRIKGITLLPLRLVEILEMSSDSGSLLSDGRSLASLNDTGSSFKEIANIIEENWEYL